MNDIRGIVIADDHAIVREGLVRLLQLEPSVNVIGQAGTADQLRNCEALQGADLLITDLSMPGARGVELVRELRELKPHLPIMVFSMLDDPAVVQAALLAGCQSYVCKSSDAVTVLSAVKQSLNGGTYIDPALTADLIMTMGEKRHPAPHARLSAREMQVMMLLVDGMGINAIAEKLFVSPKTISTHKCRIMQKLEVESVAALVRYAILHKLVKS